MEARHKKHFIFLVHYLLHCWCIDYLEMEIEFEKLILRQHLFLFRLHFCNCHSIVKQNDCLIIFVDGNDDNGIALFINNT